MLQLHASYGSINFGDGIIPLKLRYVLKKHGLRHKMVSYRTKEGCEVDYNSPHWWICVGLCSETSWLC